MADELSGQLGSDALGNWGLGWPGPLSLQQARIQSFTASSYGPVLPGTAITLTWVTEFATTASISPGVGSVAVNGSTVVNPSATTIYILTVSDGVNPPQTLSLTIAVTSPATFVRMSVGPTMVLASSASCSLQLDLGDLVVVIAIAGDPDNSHDLTVTDNLGNSYHVDVQGGPGTYSPAPQDSVHSGNMAIFSTIVTHPGFATITNHSSTTPPLISIAALEYVPPPKMAFSQGAKFIGDDSPNATAPRFFGTGPVNTANSLVITVIQEGFSQSFSSAEGDTLRFNTVPPPGGNGGNFPGIGALCFGIFDAVVAGPGIRNSNIIANIGGSPSGFGSPNILVACYSAPLVRPANLASQGSVMPALAQNVFWPGQPQVDVALSYLPPIGSLVLVAAESFWDLNPANIPAFAVTDKYGNIYTRIVHWEGAVVGATQMNQAAAIFYTIVAHLPASGVFIATMAMTPVNIGGPGCVSVSEYALNGLNPATFQTAILTGKTSEGPNTRFISGSLSVAQRSLIAGFTAAQSNTANNAPAPFVPTDGYSIDQQWNIAQVVASPLPFWPRMGTGVWIHKYVENAGVYDGESLTLACQFGGITIFASPAPAPVPPPFLTLACPVDGGSGTVGIFYSHQMVASGGTPPYHHFHVISGSLPPGLVMDDGSGLIHGIPTTPGTFTFTTEVTDATGLTTKETCTIVISEIPTGGFCFKLLKVIATLVPARHLPTRGSVQ